MTPSHRAPSRWPRLGGALCALASASACGGGEPPSGPEAVPEWSVVEEVRIGSVDEAATALTAFDVLRVGPGGEIVTLHPREQLVRVHAADGTLLATAGGRGGGPGELMRPRTMGLAGDSLWVFDARGLRVSWFGLDGTFRSSHAYPTGSGPDAREAPRPEGLLWDGTAHGHRPAWLPMVARGEISEVAEVSLGPDGAVLDTLFVYSVLHTQWEIADPDRPASDLSSYEAQPFSDTELVVVDPGAPWVLVVGRAVDDEAAEPSFTLAAVRLDGDTIFARRVPYVSRPIPAEEVDRRVAVRAAAIGALPFPQAPTEAEAARWGRENLYVPAHWPAVTAALWGRDGTVWLRGPTPLGAPEPWSAFSPGGEPLGTVALPQGARLLAAEQGTMWGRVEDALEVPYIVRWRLDDGG